MICQTCNNTRKIPYKNGFQNCPDCNPVYADNGQRPPEPMTITLHCNSITCMQPDAPEPPVKVIINGAEIDELLSQVSAEQVYKFYGPGRLLDEMSGTDWEEYKRLQK